MDKQRLVRLGMVAMLLAAPVTTVACDREDARDAEEVGREVGEVGEDIEKEIDEADKDGKDD